MQEKLQATIPSSSKWHTEDVEVKAKSYGMTKSDFILEAVALLMKLDESVVRGALADSKESYLPLWYGLSEYINNIANENMEKDLCDGT